MAALAVATAGSLGLFWAISGRYAGFSARLAATLAVLPACAAIVFAWVLQFWIW